HRRRRARTTRATAALGTRTALAGTAAALRTGATLALARLAAGTAATLRARHGRRTRRGALARRERVVGHARGAATRLRARAGARLGLRARHGVARGRAGTALVALRAGTARGRARRGARLRGLGRGRTTRLGGRRLRGVVGLRGLRGRGGGRGGLLLGGRRGLARARRRGALARLGQRLTRTRRRRLARLRRLRGRRGLLARLGGSGRRLRAGLGAARLRARLRAGARLRGIGALLAAVLRVQLLHATDDGGFHRRRRGLDELALLLELGEKFLAGDPELLSQLMDTKLSGHCSPHLWSRAVPGGACGPRIGWSAGSVIGCRSSLMLHRALISVQVFPLVGSRSPSPLAGTVLAASDSRYSRTGFASAFADTFNARPKARRFSAVAHASSVGVIQAPRPG